MKSPADQKSEHRNFNSVDNVYINGMIPNGELNRIEKS